MKLIGQEKRKMNLGVIGLGKMGSPMVRNLLRAGHRVTVWNRTSERAKELQTEGALIAETPVDAGKGEAVVTCLADDGAVETVVFGGNGLAGALARSCIHISMSTLSLALTRRLAVMHREAGQKFIAAPVFGRPDAAAAAKLLIVAAGDTEAIAQCQPVFDALGQRTIAVGTEPEASTMVKLVGNFLLVSAVESLSEATALLRKSRVDPQTCLETLTNTLFASPVYQNYAGLMLRQHYDPGFRLALGLKDVGLALAAAESSGAPLPTARLLRERLIQAIERGYQNKDLAALALLSAAEAGLPLDSDCSNTSVTRDPATPMLPPIR
jgi:3-hydroxyisobutyrate dehydrogenase-like beta-hydroxyacid dehydrogenase